MISFAALFIDMTEHHIFYCLSTVPVNCLDGWSDPLSFYIFFGPAILCPSPKYWNTYFMEHFTHCLWLEL